MLRSITAFALAISPLAVALLTHQAIQRAWLPAIPWWDKLLLVAGFWGSLVYWSYRYDRAHFRQTLALGVRPSVYWGGKNLALGGPLEGGGWPWELAGGALTLAAAAWYVVGLVRGPLRDRWPSPEASPSRGSTHQ